MVKLYSVLRVLYKSDGKIFHCGAYFHVGNNPYDLMRDAISVVRVHLGTFRLLEEKNPQKSSIALVGAHGMPFISQYSRAGRRVAWSRTGSKKREVCEIQSGTMLSPDAPGFDQEKHDEKRGGLKALISDLKRQFPSLDDVFAWHALCGAWGGVRPGTTHLNSEVTPARMTADLEKTMFDLTVVMVERPGLDLLSRIKLQIFMRLCIPMLLMLLFM
ncbi:hypothetical protein BUALT_Bualt04G0064200 [Buddleja alternifolia]|uniref:Uncharacterized protein n=1 Tax=Buddleja alternifolia TaxID=168488 RepID=A0AAV6XXD9_9LAMI|nr:hypothetical protein BUALT_Bualt04G0064200 [Buddleja alternifolia]